MADIPQVPIYDMSGEQPTLGDIHPDDVQSAVESGQYALPTGKPIQAFSPEGTLGDLHPEDASEAFKNGYKYATPKLLQEHKYGTASQQAITGLEGAASGLTGFGISEALEKEAGVPEEDIVGRHKINPWWHGAGEVAGLGAGLLTGTGEAALMTKAGEAAKGVAGLGDAAKVLSFGQKVGSEAVKQAAEMAVMQGSDEVSKMLLHDPDTSAESALSNIGLSTALGAGAGGLMAGAVSPLWQATAGPKVDEFLGAIANHLNGRGAVMPEALSQAETTLGMNLSPEMKKVLSGDPRASMLFNELREAQNPQVMQSIKELHESANKGVISGLGVVPEDAANYSENQAGHDLVSTLKKEYQQHYEPVQKQYDALKVDNAGVRLSDEEKLAEYARIVEKGQEYGAGGSPFQKVFEDYGNRVLAQDTLGHMDKLVTEVNNEIKKAYRSGDSNTYQALKQIKDSFQNFSDNQITKVASQSERGGVEGASAAGRDLMRERANATQSYAKIANISNDLASHLGLGDFKGAQSFMAKLGESKSPEQVLKALSPKGNADVIPFLQQYFPQTLEKVRENELQQLVRPSILSAKGEDGINLKTLNNAVEKMTPEMRNFVLPKGAADKIAAAKTLTSALPDFKSSGTAGWTQKLMRFMPQSSMAAVSFLTGHNPIVGMLLGHGTQVMGKDVPEAMKLGLLKFISSDQPIKSEGFKAMVDFMNNTYKGETALAKASINVFKPGAQVLAGNNMPSQAERDKLDKQVTMLQKNPNMMLKMQDPNLGHYLPNHQTSIAKSVAGAAMYLQTLKPQDSQPNPLDTKIKPTPQQEARYNRALDIAINPMLVLQHVKNGTVQPTDIQDLHNMYPALYKQMSQRLTNAMVSRHSDEEQIPYKTRMGISLLLGQPMDASMTPTSIQASQMAQMPKSPMPPQGQPKKGSPSKLKDPSKSYMTPNQSSEAHKADKD